LVNHFYFIIVRNLREYVPKSIGEYYVKPVKHYLRFYLLTEINQHIYNENVLEEDPEVKKHREYYINLYKILKNSEKIMLGDEEYLNINFSIKKIIKLSEENPVQKKQEVKHKEPVKNVNDHTYVYNHIEHDNKSQDSKYTGIIHKEEEVKVKEVVKDVVKEHKQAEVIQSGHNKANSINTMPNTNTVQQVKPKASPKLQSLLRDNSEPKKKDPMVTISMNPNSSDIKDTKVAINMDAETAYKLYQDNKQYLPSKEQMIAGASKGADFVQQNNEIITGSKGNPEKKKGIFDPLTSLFGMGGNKKDSQQQSSKPQPTKGTF
jgi:hypothetical protein